MNDSPTPDNIDIRLVSSAPVEGLIALYKDAGWWKEIYEDNHDFLYDIPRSSALFAGAFAGKKLIGMGRALSDLSSDAYIQDVVVLKDYRGKGIGASIIRELISGLKQNGVDWIGLIGEPGTESFYQRLGFQEMKGHVPFKLKE